MNVEMNNHQKLGKVYDGCFLWYPIELGMKQNIDLNAFFLLQTY
jgi:hypothetical protein